MMRLRLRLGRCVPHGSTYRPSCMYMSSHTLRASGVQPPFTVAVVGAPMSYGQPLDGVDLAPAAMRGSRLQSAITSAGWRFVDHGNVIAPQDDSSVFAAQVQISRPSDIRNALAVGRSCEAIAGKVASLASDGRFVLTLGGDHAVAMGSLAGILRARPQTGVIWVDAHADVNTPEASPSGNMHGMPLAFLMRLTRPEAVPGCGWLASFPALAPSSLAYIGLRDLDASEKATIRRLGIYAMTMHDIDRYGIGKCVDGAIAHLCAGGPRPLHISFDIDAVEPSLAPSTGTAVPGGLSYREAHFVCEAAAETGLLGSMDIVEVNPLLIRKRQTSTTAETADDANFATGSNATVALAVELVASALGKTILPPSTSRNTPPQA